MTYQSRFLYVAFQLDDICEQTSDEDIREVIKHLPKDLPEIFERALSRISRSGPGKVRIAEKVFRWVAAAKRPLYIEELHEAIAIEPCQPFFVTEKLINDIDQIVSFCGGLVTLDEEEDLVQFAHHSVKKFLLSDFSSALSENFRFQLSQADHEAGEICVTYLNFDDFKRQVAKVPSPRPPVDPRAILTATLSSVPHSKVSSSWSRLERLWNNRRKSNFDTLNYLSHVAGENDTTSFQKPSNRYAFLAYASKYWLSHTADFEERNTPTWGLWKHLLATSDPLAQAPWTCDDWTGRTRALTQYVVENNHCALLRLIEDSKPNDFPQTEKKYLLRQALFLGYAGLYESLLEPLLASGNVSEADLALSFFGAAANGQTESVRRLLKIGVDATSIFVEYKPKGMIALDEVFCDGPHKMIQWLLKRKGDFRTQEAQHEEGLRPLHLAAMFGHLSVIDILLERGSEIEAMTQYDLHTALHLAARQGQESAIQALLAKGADLKPKDLAAMTALHLAARYGHGSVVQLLLTGNADLETKSLDGVTALHHAAHMGHVSVVQLLITNNANIETKDRYGDTALHQAAYKGHVSVVQLLITADANIETKDQYGRTALHQAARMGHVSVIQLLITSGANIETKDQDGLTALHHAVIEEHITATQLLLRKAADVNAKTKDSSTVLDMAKIPRYGKNIRFEKDLRLMKHARSKEIIKLLKEHQQK